MLLSFLATDSESWLFGLFGIIIILFLIVDLGLLHKNPEKITQKSALLQTLFWVAISIAFGGLIYFYGGGPEDSLEFFSAYITEKALSMDNIFVILLILRYFAVKEENYHNILFWGILGAIVFRAVFIFVGAFLVTQFYWILYIFGGFLVYSGIKIFFENGEEEIEPEKNILVRMARKVLPITNENADGHFIKRINGKMFFTHLFIVIILIESTDLIFAVDSIPAAFAITQNEFIIYTSNIFAVMGLRAMFFLLANVLDKFYLLQKGLSFVLVFIGAKMLLEYFEIHIPIFMSFGLIVAAIFFSIVLSLIFPVKEEIKEEQSV